MFEKWISRLLGLFGESLPPRVASRDPEAQSRLDEKTASLSLYHFDACPYCVHVREAIDRLGLNIELRNIRKEKSHAKELIAQGGKGQVPCLRIDKPKGGSVWLYESSAIISRLVKKYGG